MKKINHITKNAEESIKLAEDFAKDIKAGSIIGLIGELATGKTTFVKGILKGLEYQFDVTSPTFTLVNNYTAKYNVVHADFYREPNIKRWTNIGFSELMYNSDIVLIEWANLIPDILPDNTIFIKFEHYQKNKRKIYLL